VAPTAHEGFDFQAGGQDLSEKPASPAGRWVAAMIAACVGGKSAANASWNFAGSIANSVAVPPFSGYWGGTSAEFRTLSFESFSTSPSVSPSSGAKAAT